MWSLVWSLVWSHSYVRFKKEMSVGIQSFVGCVGYDVIKKGELVINHLRSNKREWNYYFVTVSASLILA